MEIMVPDELPSQEDAWKKPLSRKEEIQLAGTMDRSGEAIAAALRRLPDSHRRFLMGENSHLPEGSSLPGTDVLRRRIQEVLVDSKDEQLLVAVDEILQHSGFIETARERLVLANLDLVGYLASQYGNSGVPFLDRFQEGILGLMLAVDRFDCTRGRRLSTYASFWIRRSISGVVSRSSIIRVPQRAEEKIRNVQRVSSELFQSLGRRPTQEELAQGARLSTQRVWRLLGMARVESLESLAERNGRPGEEVLRNRSAADPLQTTVDRDLRRHIGRALEQLKPRERRILRLHFGMGAEKPLSLRSIGERLRISAERVRQIEAQAFEKLRKKVGDAPQLQAAAGEAVRHTP